MIFTPYPDEAQVIEAIKHVRNDDYVLLRLTQTMIDKNNLDANELFRAMLYNHGIADYDDLKNGGNHGIVCVCKLILPERTQDVRIKFYRVNNTRGDRRFSIEMLGRKAREGVFQEGDLLYISAYSDSQGNKGIFIVNLTHNVPSESAIIQAIGIDPIAQKFQEIKPRLLEIRRGGFYANSKGAGAVAPKDVGDTLESLLNLHTNNYAGADLDGLIELKAKSAKTLDTLFTLRPQFAGTEVARFELDDRSRVSAFARLYGYDSEKHPGYSSLYITIGSEDYPQNNRGFYLEVNEKEPKVCIMRINPQTQKKEEVAYWSFSDLRRQLIQKHPATLWFKADVNTDGAIAKFAYPQIEFTRSPQFMTFLSLIKMGIITYDWRGYTTKTGNYSGKNHGNAWRIKPAYRSQLFGETEIISDDE